MDINTAIEKLTKLKKMSKSLGNCDLVGFDNESFTIRVKYDNDVSSSCHTSIAFEHRPIQGFSETIA